MAASNMTSYSQGAPVEGRSTVSLSPEQRNAWRASVASLGVAATVATLATPGAVWLGVQRWLSAGSSLSSHVEAVLLSLVPAVVAAWCWRSWVGVRRAGPMGPWRRIVTAGPRAALVSVALLVELLARAAGELHPGWSPRVLIVRFVVLGLVGVLLIADLGWQRGNQT